MMEAVLTRNVGKGVASNISASMDAGAYWTLEKAFRMKPEKIIDQLIKSELRGRGGAGFPVGRKWQITRSQTGEPKYVICNADEGEPGTFKDRVLLRHDPYALIEAMIIAGYAVGAHEGFIYIRGEYFEEISIIEKALTQARHRGLLGDNILSSKFDFDIKVYVGAGAYICGDETALFQSMEGKRANPREKPPFPVQSGFKSLPTLINNVETLCNIPLIIRNGPNWFSSIGPDGSKGPKLFCVSGHVNNPGVYEMPMGVTLRYLIEKCAGGMKGGRFKAALPGGLASSLVTSPDVRMDFYSLAKAGSMLGSGAIIVFNDDTDMVEVTRNVVEYFIDESCGQCTPCREGAIRAGDILNRIIEGRGRAGDLELLLELGEVMRDTARCGLGQSALNVAVSAIRSFRDEFERYGLRKRGAER